MVMGTDYVVPMEMAVTSLRSMMMKLHLEGNLAAKKQKHSKLVHLLLPPSPSTSAPVPTAPVSPPTPGTPYPTHTAPTPYPTHIAPTMYPTAAADPVPTPYPTDIPPTSYPTE